VVGLYRVPGASLHSYDNYNALLLLAAPILIGYGFLFETLGNPGIDREIGTVGVIMVFAWLLSLPIGLVYNRIRHGDTGLPQ
jgi:hypothetical protein